MKLPLSNEKDRLFYGDSEIMKRKIKRDFNPSKYKIFFHKDEILKFRDLDYYLADVTTMNNPLLVIDKLLLNMPSKRIYKIEYEEPRNL